MLSTLTKLVARALDPQVAASALVDELVPYVDEVRAQAGAARAVLFAWDPEIGEFIKNVSLPRSPGGDDSPVRDAVRAAYQARWQGGAVAGVVELELGGNGRGHVIMPLVAADALVGALVLAEPDRARLSALATDPCALLGCMLLVIQHARVSNELDRQRQQRTRSNRTLDRTLAEYGAEGSGARDLLKRIVAEQAVDISMLKDLQRGKW